MNSSGLHPLPLVLSLGLLFGLGILPAEPLSSAPGVPDGDLAGARTGAPQQTGTLLIHGVLLVDGSGAPPYRASVRVRGTRIEEVGELSPLPGDRIVDGEGLALAPGFIDTHSHHDRGLVEEPEAFAAVSQGITTIVVGQDGGSNLPIADFFRSADSVGVAVNVASYAGHGTLRREVMGEDFRREATPEEVTRMRELLRREMMAGALGLSTGLEYDPGIYASTDEVVALAREAAALGGRYITHIRSEDRHLVEAVEEALTVGREAGIPVQISHLKLAMTSLWGAAEELLQRLDRARSEGVEVTADVYPYTYWQSTMTVLFPDRDYTDREAASFALRELAPPEGFRIASYEPEPSYEGRTLAEVSAERGEDPVTTYLALIARAQTEEAGESMIGTSMSEEDVIRLLQWPHTNVSSDGGLRGAHPRGFGAFTRVLGPWVRGGHLTLEAAVHRMTGLSARHMGLEDRGIIRPGAPADLVLFDPATVADRATPDDPHAPSTGIRQVWVNGVSVLEDGAVTEARPGEVIRRTDLPRVPQGWEEVDRLFEDLDRSTEPGCALGVIREGELAYARGYGIANLEEGIPVTPSSTFRIASVSKQFTAAVVLRLREDGFLSLEDPVRLHLPELPELGPGFTVRSLLNHTSGIRDYLTLMSLAGMGPSAWYSDEDVMEMLIRQEASNFEPGTEHLYSNSGYFLISQLVPRLTGRTLAEYAEARLFRPLGMHRTHFHDDPTVLVPGRAVGYRPTEDGGYRIHMTTLPMVGDGGIFTSIEELVHWDRALDGLGPSGPTLPEALMERGRLSSGDSIDYALGLAHGTHRGLRTLGHGGSFVGYRAASLRFPEEGLSLYLLCNRSDADPGRRLQELGEVLLGDRMVAVPEDPEGPKPASPSPPESGSSPDGLPLSREEAADYLGHFYAPELNTTYRIRWKAGGGEDGGDASLHLEVAPHLDGPLLRAGEDDFRRGALTLRFERRDGTISGFLLDAGRVRGIHFQRWDPVVPGSPQRPGMTR